MTKQEKLFNAVLAKNDIAREVAYFRINKNSANFNLIIDRLTEIEKFIGTENQPSAEDIFNNNSNPNKKFDI